MLSTFRLRNRDIIRFMLADLSTLIGYAVTYHRGDTMRGNPFFRLTDLGVYAVSLHRELTPFGRRLFGLRVFAPLVNAYAYARERAWIVADHTEAGCRVQYNRGRSL